MPTATSWRRRVLLVQQGSLTAYQARKLLSGATRGFFLAGYRILRPLGEGGMGKVFLGSRDRDGQHVAIKVLPPKRAVQEEQALLRFRREMDLSRRVQHPNLARTIEVGREGDIYFMIMEFIPGESLYETVKGPSGGPLRVPDTARFFLKVLDGLAAAHAAGLVHRDLKPGNIMVTPEGEAKVLDLGLARALGGDEGDALTRPNVVIGTLDYASPEQLGNAAAADRRSDLYSIGCTLYFTLSGHPPFEGGDVVNKIFKQRMDLTAWSQVLHLVPASARPGHRPQADGEEPRRPVSDLRELRATLPAGSTPIGCGPTLTPRPSRCPRPSASSPLSEDDDLRILAGEDGSPPVSFSLRDLGAAEPAAAPVPRPPSGHLVKPPRLTLSPPGLLLPSVIGQAPNRSRRRRRYSHAPPDPAPPAPRISISVSISPVLPIFSQRPLADPFHRHRRLPRPARHPRHHSAPLRIPA